MNNQPVELKAVCERCQRGWTFTLRPGQDIRLYGCPTCGDFPIIYRVEHPRKGCV